MARLGVEYYNSNYSSLCRELVRAKYIGVFDAKKYNLGFIYYLKEKGARIVAEHFRSELQTINYVKSNPTNSPATLHHRTYAIACQIELFKTCEEHGIEIEFYDRDIETLGSIKKNKNLERKTRVALPKGKFLEPDAIFRIDTAKGKKLYTVELENEDFTKKSFAKIQRHIRAYSIRSVSKKYHHPKAWRNLFVYVDEGTMKSVMGKCAEIPDIKNWFLFKSYSDIATPVILKKGKFNIGEGMDFFKGWQNAAGAQVSMF